MTRYEREKPNTGGVRAAVNGWINRNYDAKPHFKAFEEMRHAAFVRFRISMKFYYYGSRADDVRVVKTCLSRARECGGPTLP